MAELQNLIPLNPNELSTGRHPIQRFFTANNAGSSIAVPADGVIDPTFSAVTGIIDRPTRGSNGVKVWPFGTDAANEVFDYALIGRWPGKTIDGTWVTSMLAHFTATLGSMTGVANGLVTASEYYADTLVLDGGLDSVKVYSPADNSKAWALIDAMGAWSVQLIVNVNTAASGNALVTWM